MLASKCMGLASMQPRTREGMVLLAEAEAKALAKVAKGKKAKKKR